MIEVVQETVTRHAAKKIDHLRPLGDRVVVRLDKPADRTQGGLYLPDGVKQTITRTGEVLAVGPGKYSEHIARGDALVTVPVRVKNGDRVLFGQYGGCEVDGDRSLLILSEAEILAVVE